MKSDTVRRLCVTLALLFAATAPLNAKMAWNKKSKELDPGVTGCISCHEKEKPKKNEPLTERGIWLMDEMEKRGAKKIDLAWLKDYPNNGK